ncbi:hypothetical protein KI387_010770, partial [Taxus chinensis]
PLVDHTTGLKSTIISRSTQTNEIIESGISQLQDENEKTHSQIDEIQKCLSSELPKILPRIQEISHKLTPRKEGDWSKAVSWSEVQQLANPTPKKSYKEVLEEYKPLFFKDKEVNMLRIEGSESHIEDPQFEPPVFDEQMGES